MNWAVAATHENTNTGLAHFLRKNNPMDAMVPEKTANAKQAVAHAGMPSKTSLCAWLSNVVAMKTGSFLLPFR